MSPGDRSLIWRQPRSGGGYGGGVIGVAVRVSLLLRQSTSRSVHLRQALTRTPVSCHLTLLCARNFQVLLFISVWRSVVILTG